MSAKKIGYVWETLHIYYQMPSAITLHQKINASRINTEQN